MIGESRILGFLPNYFNDAETAPWYLRNASEVESSIYIFEKLAPISYSPLACIKAGGHNEVYISGIVSVSKDRNDLSSFSHDLQAELLSPSCLRLI